MLKPPIPKNETARLQALYEYQVMDSLPEDDYDSLTQIASKICQMPVSLITLMDAERQWFKSKYGTMLTENTRNLTFCAHGMTKPNEPLIVPDATKDPRFSGNPLVTGDLNLRFYTGINLVNPSGYVLGSLCVFDVKPNNISETQLELLKTLGNQVVKLLELRKKIFHLEKAKEALQTSVQDLEEFAQVVAHDIKAPVRNMGFLATAISEDYMEKVDDTGKKYLKKLKESATDAVAYINGVLNYSKATHFVELENSEINLTEFIEKVVKQIDPPAHIQIQIQKDLPTIKSTPIVLQQILLNLISNAVKYNNKDKGWVKIKVDKSEDSYIFRVSDNGQGVPTAALKSIFSLFYMVNKSDAQEKGSSGIGLSIVEKNVKKLGGGIAVTSKEGEGTTFEFSIPQID